MNTFFVICFDKFIISMENSIGDTYITEKVLHGLLADTIPIYWGTNNIV